MRDWLAVAAADIALDKRSFLAGVVLAAVALAAVFYFSVVIPFGPRLAVNWGFSPEWDCGNPIKGSDLVCIKKPLSPRP